MRLWRELTALKFTSLTTMPASSYRETSLSSIGDRTYLKSRTFAALVLPKATPAHCARTSVPTTNKRIPVNVFTDCFELTRLQKFAENLSDERSAMPRVKSLVV